MKTISVLDTSICSSNLGDQIIMNAVNNILEDLFEDSLRIHIQTHDVISRISAKIMQTSELIIIGGTNLLSSNMNYYNQWKVNLWDSLFIKNIILMGVGWWQYQKSPNLYTKILYQRLLSKEYIHSVRDEYTKRQLNSIGITNVVNTSCPTVWSLTKEQCSGIPKQKSDSVLVTFTEYNQNPKLDYQLINLLRKKYKKIYFWTQQPKDYEYMQKFCGEQATYVKPSLKSLDRVLSSCEIDYLGTRLHAGIRALQHRKRTMILAVDNRATEISRDINLPVIRRDEIETIEKWIDSCYETKIDIPEEKINQWKNQFK
jgi:polysaccharide pyruvyl transferase WcaK-like protein